ncbi:MAG TPA: phage holin family protein [Chitinophaga sp.]|uniref:Phage holin family protein n=1 Tax=Chitinophaga tropicalis TaxID=2683588 RepID=A0A7K1TYR1_9BACT|nr:phage holin family protein [Chitinophaga tropicalis]MVT07196.1 phage holin family protein [Chitinophaga tropicalis]HJT72416.1 phage holin family protein [Chitinophaga sp.]
MNFLLRLLVTALAAMLTAYVLPGVRIKDFITALVLALVLAILNMLVKPVLVILTLPATILTLGLFLLVINAIIILLASKLVSGFKVDGFFWALIFSLVLTIVSGIMHSLAGTGADD